MDNLTVHIDFTNPHLARIPADDDYSTESSVSVSKGDVRLNNDVESAPPPELPPPATNIAPEGAIQHQWVNYHDGGRLICLNYSHYSYTHRSKQVPVGACWM